MKKVFTQLRGMSNIYANGSGVYGVWGYRYHSTIKHKTTIEAQGLSA